MISMKSTRSTLKNRMEKSALLSCSDANCRGSITTMSSQYTRLE